MLFKTIQSDLISAMKLRDVETKDVLSLLISEMKTKAIDLRTEELSDVDALGILQKFIKKMEDERDCYMKASRQDTADKLSRQLNSIKKYLPKMLSEDEIINEINKLEDKSMKSVMTHFKNNFAGKVDMGLVSKIARGA